DGIPDDADPDDDNDGMSDEDEAIAGTDPLDPGDRFHVSRLRQGYGEQAGFVLEFEAVTGRLYDVLYKDDLLDTNEWRVLTNDWPGTAGEFTDVIAVTQRFYTIRVKLAPP
ncbi:MAG: hypothetical protein JXR37_27620, partial [Kiritimatiellae bacterium]|nr:hypothetical protein [Kiritimatiellia bacterium]